MLQTEVENPEAYLDVLTIRSLRERYNNYSTHGDSVLQDFHVDPSLLVKQEELELLVRDFTIDDSISDCFADSDVDATTVIGVDCKPSSKVALVSPLAKSSPGSHVTQSSDIDYAVAGGDNAIRPQGKKSNFVAGLFHRKVKSPEKEKSKVKAALKKGPDRSKNKTSSKIIPKSSDKTADKSDPDIVPHKINLETLDLVYGDRLGIRGSNLLVDIDSYDSLAANQTIQSQCTHHDNELLRCIQYDNELIRKQCVDHDDNFKRTRCVDNDSELIVSEKGDDRPNKHKRVHKDHEVCDATSNKSKLKKLTDCLHHEVLCVGGRDTPLEDGADEAIYSSVENDLDIPSTKEVDSFAQSEGRVHQIEQQVQALFPELSGQLSQSEPGLAGCQSACVPGLAEQLARQVTRGDGDTCSSGLEAQENTGHHHSGVAPTLPQAPVLACSTPEMGVSPAPWYEHAAEGSLSGDDPEYPTLSALCRAPICHVIAKSAFTVTSSCPSPRGMSHIPHSSHNSHIDSIRNLTSMEVPHRGGSLTSIENREMTNDQMTYENLPKRVKELQSTGSPRCLRKVPESPEIIQQYRHGFDDAVAGSDLRHGDDVMPELRSAVSDVANMASDVQPLSMSSSERQFAHLLHAMQTADLETLIHELGIMAPPLALGLHDHHGNTLCHVACRDALLPALRTILVLQPALRDTKNHRGLTPAATAISAGQAVSLDVLLSHKSADDVGVTSENEMAELVRLAVQLGQESAILTISRHQGSPWVMALEDKGGNSLLHLAAHCGQPGAAMTLISLGCSTNKLNDYGHLPLHYALHDGRQDPLHDASKSCDRTNPSKSPCDDVTLVNRDIRNNKDNVINDVCSSNDSFEISSILNLNKNISISINRTQPKENQNMYKQTASHEKSPFFYEDKADDCEHLAKSHIKSGSYLQSDKQTRQNGNSVAQTDETRWPPLYSSTAQIILMDMLSQRLVQALHTGQTLHSGLRSTVCSGLEMMRDQTTVLQAAAAKLEQSAQAHETGWRENTVALETAARTIDSVTSNNDSIIKMFTNLVAKQQESVSTRDPGTSFDCEDVSRLLHRKGTKIASTVDESSISACLDTMIKSELHESLQPGTDNLFFQDYSIPEHSVPDMHQKENFQQHRVSDGSSDSRFSVNFPMNSNRVNIDSFNQRKSSHGLVIEADQQYPIVTEECVAGPKNENHVFNDSKIRRSERDGGAINASRSQDSIHLSERSSQIWWLDSDNSSNLPSESATVIRRDNSKFNIQEETDTMIEDPFADNFEISQHEHFDNNRTCLSQESTDSNVRIAFRNIERTDTYQNTQPDFHCGAKNSSQQNSKRDKLSDRTSRSQGYTSDERSHGGEVTKHSRHSERRRRRDIYSKQRHGRSISTSRVEGGRSTSNSRVDDSRSTSTSRVEGGLTATSSSVEVGRSNSVTRLDLGQSSNSISRMYRRERRRRQSQSETRMSRRSHSKSRTSREFSSTSTSEGDESARPRKARSRENKENQLTDTKVREHRRRKGESGYTRGQSSKSSSKTTQSEDEEEVDEDDDDDDKLKVRLNVASEDLSDEGLRVQRLQRHLQSVQKLSQKNDDVIETVITGTGERLTSDALAKDEGHVNIGAQYPFGAGALGVKAQSSSPDRCKGGKRQLQAVRGITGRVRKVLGAKLFNHHGLEENKVRELTESEFRETYDRRYDVTVRRRREMDEGIPWGQLNLSESEDTDASERPDVRLTSNDVIRPVRVPSDDIKFKDTETGKPSVFDKSSS